jgi:transposase
MGRSPLCGCAQRRGYDSNRFRAALIKRDITPCIPPTRNRTIDIPYDKTLNRQRHHIENMLGRLKDWRRIATRYDVSVRPRHRGIMQQASERA